MLNDWPTDRIGNCADQPDDIKELFFSDHAEDWVEAKKLCRTCPIREECLRASITNAEVVGVWGGVDENLRRRNLGIDSEGRPHPRGRGPLCFRCGASTSSLSPWRRENGRTGRWSHLSGVTCMECGFEWVSTNTYNAVVIKRKANEKAG